jgi:ABC-2 type transport system permease protein
MPTPSKYNQVTAMLAITKASLRAIFRSPSAVVFSIAFPLIFILVFGFIGGSGKISVSIAFDKYVECYLSSTEKYSRVKNCNQGG